MGGSGLILEKEDHLLLMFLNGRFLDLLTTKNPKGKNYQVSTSNFWAPWKNTSKIEIYVEHLLNYYCAVKS